MQHNIWKGPNGLRAGWRLLIYAALVIAFGYVSNHIADAILRGQQPDPGNPAQAIVYFSFDCTFILLAAWIMGKMEGRSLADYGLPWRRAFCRQFWQAWAISFISLSVLLTILHVARAYSLGSAQLHGADIAKYALLWAAAMTLAPILEEFFYRGYLQFTLTSGIRFWPAALITSAWMGAAHMLNPGWNFVGVFATAGYGLVACLLLRRTGDLWMPIGLHAGWNWSELYFYGVPSGGFAPQGHLFNGNLHGPVSLTGMPYGVEASWLNIALLIIWWFVFAKWFREVRYPRQTAPVSKETLNAPTQHP
ncbi:MAG: type II CAAX endopeptidase family protein [Candidatus Acidiferrales bacterium]